MDNYEMIMSMNRKQLSELLTEVYLTGVEETVAAANEHEIAMLLRKGGGFNLSWLNREGESTLLDGSYCKTSHYAQALQLAWKAVEGEIKKQSE